MKTAKFQQQMKQRNAIEGTHSELTRGHGLRRPPPGPAESHTPELSDWCGLQRQTLDPTPAMGNQTRDTAGAEVLQES
jgi:hypothetical protein